MADNLNTSAHEEELARYLAIDPSTTSSKPFAYEATSAFLKKVMIILMVVIMAIHIFMAFAVNSGNTGAGINWKDQAAFIGVGLILSACCLLLLRPRVRVNEDGVEVRNFLGPKFYPWSIIYGLNFPKGSRWARLELPEFEYVNILALQSGDGAYAVNKVKEFRTFESRYMPTD